ncbi:polysaccharide biosynthesis protein GtrA [Haloarcula taiwanensis]|uniref:Polysaccharide biosynthesis protein GtrA n=1 Tax=Haloarcula taiwanensis TaxID=1932004 RepID=A0A2H4ZZU6_9EURY|nr:MULTISPECIES: GtrA family protein [Haloarcula]AUG47999.1 polysaccharide biosynthesis protein GtrA [Haloarcula taiwanensis]RLM39356.1 GtrA family protein [Haloarcula sp. Atlit-120R]RLM47254.1 GtrA family protein [Haloarcula sp. Atlit-47R]
MASAVVTPARRQQLVRFFLVGVVAASAQTVLLWSFVDVGGLNYILGAALAIELTILFQYVLNNAWTFHRSQHSTLKEYMLGMGKTNLVRGTAIPLQLGLLYAFVTWGGVTYLIGNGGAIVITGVYRYALDAHWTWG